jgi:hypothetical protein
VGSRNFASFEEFLEYFSSEITEPCPGSPYIKFFSGDERQHGVEQGTYESTEI